MQELQTQWYQKLTKSGFEDIEDEEGRLLKWSTHASCSSYAASTEEYYRLAQQFVYDRRFRGRKDKVVWRLHAQGLTVDAIVKRGGRHRVKLSHGDVERRIERLRGRLFGKRIHK